MRHSRSRLSALLLLLACAPAVARAQDTQGNAFDLELFRPALDSKGYITVNATELLGHLDFSFGLVSSFAHNVLNLRRAGSPNRFDVENLLTPQLQAALGLWKWVELGASLPVHILFGSRSPGFRDPSGNGNLDSDLHFSGQSVGDLGIHLKARVLDVARHRLGLGVALSVYAPTGDARRFLGEGQVTFRPQLLVDTALGRSRRFRLALNVGALVRPAKHAFTDRGQTLDMRPDVAGSGPFCQPAAGTFPPPGDPACATGATRALGTQLTYGLGAAYAIVPQKLDLVGELFGAADLTGSASAHPLEGLLAAKVYLASKSYFEIGGGAGLLPRSVAGGMTGSPELRVFVGFVFEPSIGDRDGDGIKDDVDKCPDDPEDFDGFEDEDGCPDPDNDRDGILDRDDHCPNQPGPLENHGCPYSDIDKDGVLDKDDECPRVPGPVENHGCPPKSITRLRGGKLVVLEAIFFETAKATIKPISYPTLDAVAETLEGNPQLLVVEIQGHADERGDDDYNMRLTEGRAQAVRTYLIDKGVAPERLEAHGYGETKPVCTEHREDCWSQNRRVEFVIRRRDDGL